MTKLKAHFDGKVLIPDEPVDLPVGRDLEIQVHLPQTPEPGEPKHKPGMKPLEELADALEQTPPNPQWPRDGAAQHDHYLYGLPKRS